MVDIQVQPAVTEIRQGIKKERRKIDRKKLQGKNIMAPLLHRASIIMFKDNSQDGVELHLGSCGNLSYYFSYEFTAESVLKEFQNLTAFGEVVGSCDTVVLTVVSCEQVKSLRTVTSNANSLMQAGADDDAYPVQGSTGTVDVLWLPEIERL